MRPLLLCRRALVAAIAILTLPVLPGLVTAQPSETPDDTPMVDGRVRAIAQVGSNVWVGGQFAEVVRRDGTVVDAVRNVAVFDSATGDYRNIAPELGEEGSEVFDMTVYGDDVVIAGDFAGQAGAQKNLVVVDGATGKVVRWYDSPVLKSVLAAPDLDRIYGGGTALSAFGFASGKILWTRAATFVDPDLRTNAVMSGYRDLELDDDGQTIWAACICDRVGGNPAKALVKLDTEGAHDASWVAKAGMRAFGLSLVDVNGVLYLGAGGSDFVAQFSKADGSRTWYRDTSGSAQAVEAIDGQLVIGGHFWEVANDPGDPRHTCGHRSEDNASTLDTNDDCQTRHGLAIYSYDGTLEPDWDPVVSGRYNLVWALHPEGTSLHVGGEFVTVDGVTQTYYARLPSPV